MEVPGAVEGGRKCVAEDVGEREGVLAVWEVSALPYVDWECVVKECEGFVDVVVMRLCVPIMIYLLRKYFKQICTRIQGYKNISILNTKNIKHK